MSRSAKANAVRDRHLIALKKTIETVLTLTDETCPSTLAIYMEELEANWANYHDAYNEHEDAIIGKEEELLKTISAEYHETRLGLIKSRGLFFKIFSAELFIRKIQFEYLFRFGEYLFNDIFSVANTIFFCLKLSFLG